MFEEYHASKNATYYLQQQIMGKTFCLIVGSNPDGTKPMTITFVFAASPIKYKMYVELMCKSKGWLSRNQNNASQWV
jgi:hypothetical protein